MTSRENDLFVEPSKPSTAFPCRVSNAIYLFIKHLRVLRTIESKCNLFDYARRSEVLFHLHSNRVKQCALIDRWSIVFENLIFPVE